MKRSDFFIRLTTGVLFLAIASYIGIYFYNAAMNVFVTTPAISYSVEETFQAEGFIVRTESALTEIRGNSVLPTVREGERVANGQPIAVEFLTGAALGTASEIRTLRMQIAQLEAAGSSRSVEASRLDSVMDLSQAVMEGNFSRLDEMALNIETLVFEIDPLDQDSLEQKRRRLELLELRTDGLRTFLAPSSGTFSHVVDGFEHIGPEAISGITPSELESLFSTPRGASGSGKLVTAFKWYFASVMDADDAARLRSGQRVTLHFSGAFHADKEMVIESIGARDDSGRSVVIFSSDRGIHDVAMLRGLSAEIVFDVVTGIRVPLDAIHIDEQGTLFIFIQTGVRAERVNIEKLREYGDVFLVRCGTETGSPLRPGSTIIVRANNLYHGKVVG